MSLVSGILPEADWSILMASSDAKMRAADIAGQFASDASGSASKAVGRGEEALQKLTENRGPVFSGLVQSTEAPKQAGVGTQVDAQSTGMASPPKASGSVR